jgi:hypothetical protein
VLTAAVIVYAIGVVVGLLRVDAAPVPRVVVALLWPLALVAAAVTISALILAAMVLFPLAGAGVVLAAAVIWWVAA